MHELLAAWGHQLRIICPTPERENSHFFSPRLNERTHILGGTRSCSHGSTLRPLLPPNATPCMALGIQEVNLKVALAVGRHVDGETSPYLDRAYSR